MSGTYVFPVYRRRSKLSRIWKLWKASRSKNLHAHGTIKYKCEACITARASRWRLSKVRDYRPLADKPFYRVSTDIEVINAPSLNGFNYSMGFIDEYSRYARVYFMNTKSTAESKRVLDDFLSDIWRLSWHMTRFRSDLGSEYVNNRKTNPI